jgi:hypothetical protein
VLRRKRPGDESATPYEGLRRNAIAAVEMGLSAPGATHPDVSGLVADVPASGGFVTIVALNDGTTSMYTSTGGGTIGAGAQPQVAAASSSLLVSVQEHLTAFDRGDDGGFPPAGQVRLHVLTPAGGRYADISEDCFWGRAPHDLLPVIAGVQGVIGALRQTPAG